jgi:hypothetical protein
MDTHTPLQRLFFIRGIAEFSTHVLSWPAGLFANMTLKHLKRPKRYAVTQQVLCGTEFELLPPSHYALWLIVCDMLRDDDAKEDIVNQMRAHHGLPRYVKWRKSVVWPEGFDYWEDAEDILLHYTQARAAARCSRIVHHD